MDLRKTCSGSCPSHLQHKPRKKNANDEPECIALSSDEDEEEDVDEKEGGEASQQAGDGSESVEGEYVMSLWKELDSIWLLI